MEAYGDNSHEQLRLFGTKLNSEHKFLLPKVVEIKPVKETTEHDDFADSLNMGVIDEEV